MAAQIEMVRNDTRPNFSGAVDFDLTGYTVTLHIGFNPVLIKTGTILTAGATESTYEFEFVTGDLVDDAGVDYLFEIQFDDNAGGIITYKKDKLEKLLKLRLLEEIA